MTQVENLSCDELCIRIFLFFSRINPPIIRGLLLQKPHRENLTGEIISRALRRVLGWSIPQNNEPQLLLPRLDYSPLSVLKICSVDAITSLSDSREVNPLVSVF